MFSSPRFLPSRTNRVTLASVWSATALALATPHWVAVRAESAPSAPSSSPSSSAPLVTGLVTHDLASGGETPSTLVQALVGPGAVVTNIQYTGAPVAAGTFSGGAGIIGFDQGIMLSSGDIASVVGPMNTDDGDYTQNGMPGDLDLDGLIDVPSNGPTRDAAILEFDLECPAGGNVSFQYVFTSEEYDEVGSYDDVFACFVNGQNVALIPGTGSHVGVLAVNCGDGFHPPTGENCGFYRTNDCGSVGLTFPCLHIPTEADGLTVVLSATGTLHPGSNHIKLAIADQGDEYADSNVFIRGQSFACSSGPPVFEAPSACNPVLRGWPGVPLTFDTRAWATNGFSGESVTLTVTGDALPLANGSFLPPLPTSPAQPATSQFTWTPTPADLGLYHLYFTATDQVQQSEVLDVPIQISTVGMPVFEAPTPCAQVLDAFAGAPFSFAIGASAWSTADCGTTWAPGQSVILTVTGDATPLSGGTFVPPLPAGPAQPVSSQFQWTPTAADVGLYHLDFTATDQLQQSSSCGVTIRVSLPHPVFQAPSPCGHTVTGAAGVPFGFTVAAAATNGEPGQSVTLSVAGDAIPLAGGTFVPPLPAGPAQPVSSQFQWTPTFADVGLYHLDFTATDQLQQSASCGVTLRVIGSPGVDFCQAGVGGVLPCPCGNPPAAAPGGCNNSWGTGGARLESTGVPLINNCTVVFTTSGQSPVGLSILFQGRTPVAAGVVYGQGVRCVGGVLKRLYVKTASGGSITAPQPGDPPVDQRSGQLGDYIQNGTNRYYAVYYRDPTVLGGCPSGSTFNVTQAQRILWGL